MAGVGERVSFGAVSTGLRPRDATARVHGESCRADDAKDANQAVLLASSDLHSILHTAAVLSESPHGASSDWQSSAEFCKIVVVW